MFKGPSLLRFSRQCYSYGQLIRKTYLRLGQRPQQQQQFPLYKDSGGGGGGGRTFRPFPVLLGSVLTVALCECAKKGSCAECETKGPCNNNKQPSSSSQQCSSCSSSSPSPGSGSSTVSPDTHHPRVCTCNGTSQCSACNPGRKPLCWEKEDLTHCFLLRQANVLTIDAITRIISETASAIEDYHNQYRQLVEMLMDLMEDSRCATESRQELINCKQIVVRSSIEDMKRNIIELESYLESVARLAHAAAETAFLASAEYASVSLLERLNSCQCQVKEIKERTLEVERASNELHSLIIVESGRGLK